MKNRKQRVLVVEDNDFIRMSLFEFLLHKGFDVGLAENGKMGLNMFNADNFDYVLTDYGMPEMNGLKMAKEIKKQHPETVIIIMSGDMRKRLQTKNVANYFIEKPFKYEVIYDILSHFDASQTHSNSFN